MFDHVISQRSEDDSKNQFISMARIPNTDLEMTPSFDVKAQGQASAEQTFNADPKFQTQTVKIKTFF